MKPSAASNDSMFSSAYAVARTKVRMPAVRAELLQRRNLAAKIAADFQIYPLTLVSAPGGYGKTTVVAQTLAANAARFSVAWVSAEAGDTAVRLAAAAIAALDPFDPPWRVSPDSLLSSIADGSTSAMRFSDHLINALAATDVARGLIVVDDAHVIADKTATEFIANLPERLPPHWGLVLLTRVDTISSLARLRALGKLAEYRQSELRFSADDVERVIASGGHRTDAHALFSRTMGWPVGVTLALSATPTQTANVRSERHIREYFHSEIVAHLPQPLRDFLAQTSVLPELTATRAAAVAEDVNADLKLDEVERRGLFYSDIGERERTLRLHDFFRDALQEDLKLRVPELIPGLLKRAAAGESDPARRIGFLLRAGDITAADDVFFGATPSLLAAGALNTVIDLTEQFPAIYRKESPTMALVEGFLAWAQWDFERMLTQMRHGAARFEAAGDLRGARLARAYEALASSAINTDTSRPDNEDGAVPAEPSPDVTTRLLERLAVTWQARDRLDFSSAAASYQTLVDSIASERQPFLWYQAGPVVAFTGTQVMERSTLAWAEGAIRAAGDNAGALRAIAISVRAAFAMWRGELESARLDIDEALAQFNWLDEPPNVAVFIYTPRTIVRTLQGEGRSALDELRQMLDRMQQRAKGAFSWAATFESWIGLRCALASENFETALHFLTLMPNQNSVPAGSLYSSLVLQSAEAYKGWLQQDWSSVIEYLTPISERWATDDFCGIATEANVRVAYAHMRLGRHGDAMQSLALGLKRVQTSGYTSAAFLAGHSTLVALAEGLPGKRLDASLRGVLQRLLDLQMTTSQRSIHDAPLVDAISPREMEVLALLAAGESNKLIARSLDLSPHTVKRHVANILGKLGVESRGQAAARYREM